MQSKEWNDSVTSPCKRRHVHSSEENIGNSRQLTPQIRASSALWMHCLISALYCLSVYHGGQYILFYSFPFNTSIYKIFIHIRWLIKTNQWRSDSGLIKMSNIKICEHGRCLIWIEASLIFLVIQTWTLKINFSSTWHSLILTESDKFSL